ncbi:hypothetical protein KIH39_19420 [Telmatocola sphagniphila]|uniref:Uncharacterized protein n=1 Tax=Telmatocola sphagniphila TaxID=1123043 RepID=A0A8E6B3Z1_9BACT|nr:hypothetical protein [Telmatocola sphagniphila]QVL31004.1 hypothetical protein KIH39_19420 [Telmatocola sphagniphila]
MPESSSQPQALSKSQVVRLLICVIVTVIFGYLYFHCFKIWFGLNSGFQSYEDNWYKLLFSEEQREDLRIYSQVIFWLSCVYLAIVTLLAIQLYRKGYTKYTLIRRGLYGKAHSLVFLLMLWSCFPGFGYYLTDEYCFRASMDTGGNPEIVSKLNLSWQRTSQFMMVLSNLQISFVIILIWWTYEVLLIVRRSENASQSKFGHEIVPSDKSGRI